MLSTRISLWYLPRWRSRRSPRDPLRNSKHLRILFHGTGNREWLFGCYMHRLSAKLDRWRRHQPLGGWTWLSWSREDVSKGQSEISNQTLMVWFDLDFVEINCSSYCWYELFLNVPRTMAKNEFVFKQFYKRSASFKRAIMCRQYYLHAKRPLSWVVFLR